MGTGARGGETVCEAETGRADGRTDGKAEDAGSGATTGADGESGTGDAGAERSARPYGRGCG